MMLSNLMTSQMLHFQIPSYLGLGIPHTNLEWGYKHSAHNRLLSKYLRMCEREVVSGKAERKRDITDGIGARHLGGGR